MKINPNTLKEFRYDFADAMLKLENKYGLAIRLTTIKYTDAGFTPKVEVRNLDNSGEPMIDPIQEAKAKFAVGKHVGHIAVSGGVIGHRWKLNGGDEVYVTGFNSKNSKYPLLYERNGQSYKGPAYILKERI